MMIVRAQELYMDDAVILRRFMFGSFLRLSAALVYMATVYVLGLKRWYIPQHIRCRCCVQPHHHA